MSLSSRFLLAALLASPGLHAGVKWVPLVPGTPPGAKAEVGLDAQSSDSQRTVIAIKVLGFWSETVKGPDGKSYERIEVPGLPSIGQLGAPMLPAARFRIGVVTGAPSVSLASAKVIASKTFEDVLIWPQPKEAAAEVIDPSEDPGPGDPDGTPEVFTLDAEIYGLKTPWPPSAAESSAKVMGMFGDTEGASCVCYPVSWVPSTKVLRIATHTEYTFSHAGTPLKLKPCTKDKGKMLASAFVNATEVAAWWPQNLVAYAGRYLIVTQTAFVNALQPFVDQKKQCGFHVTVKTIAAGASATTIRQAIGDWYDDGDASDDHYCLLVGDVEAIPQRLKAGIGYDQGDVWTDDEYGSPFDLDLDEEVFVGRLSIDGVADLEAQIAKIIAYEDSPHPFGKYGTALMTAHEGGSPPDPSGFQLSQETIVSSWYDVSPSFITAFPTDGATNQDVIDAIETGVGIVCYDGHGSTNAWSGWNGDSFHKNDVLGLSNSLQPILWSMACTNMNLATAPGADQNDCFGETWMEHPDAGAVAAYAATTVSWVKQNHKIAQHLFEAVFDEGLTRHGQAIAWAEARAQEDWPNQTNTWMYLLLGDPSMHVRRKAPLELELKYPLAVSPCLFADCLEIEFEVLELPGPPVEGALVSLWKSAPGNSEAADEVFVNGYTDALGKVVLPVAPKTAGQIHYVVRNDDGVLRTGTIAVGPCSVAASDQTYGKGKAGSLGIPTLKGLDPPRVGQTTTIELGNAKPGSLATLILGAQPVALPFDGGTLLVSPQLLVPVPVPVPLGGKLVIQGTLPADPALCGAKIFHQVIFTDSGAAGWYHQAMTNGLVRILGS